LEEEKNIWKKEWNEESDAQNMEQAVKYHSRHLITREYLNYSYVIGIAFEVSDLVEVPCERI
jgi:hypothetical protein